MQATMRRSAAPQAIVNGDVIWKSIAAIAGVIAIVAGVLVLRGEPNKSIDGRSATVWLSGEGKSRIVLAAARAQRPSFAVSIAGLTGPYDLADLGKTVIVQDRPTGSLIELNGVDGTELAREDAPIPVSERPMVVAAGAVGYLVDVAQQAVERFTADGKRGATKVLDYGFTDWVGTTDGQLWTVNADQGTVGTFNGETVRSRSFGTRGGTYLLTAAGVDPVVVDKTESRVRWLRRDTSIEVPGLTAEAVQLGQVVVQGPDPEATCVVVAAGSSVSCVGPSRVERTIALPAGIDLVGAQVYANRDDIVFVWSANQRVVVLAWGDGSTQEFTRTEPSARQLVGSASTGPIVVDDPGSTYAFTVSHGSFVELDKFSKRTVVISADGSGPDGVGVVDENADVAGVFTGGQNNAPPPDNDGQNDPPLARPDKVVTRAGRSIQINVLANDVDPDGDAMVVTAAGPVPEVDGFVAVSKGARVSYQPPATSIDRSISFPYTISDINGAEASSNVTVEIVGSDRNTPPEAVDDQAKTVVNTAIDIPVTLNDKDGEGDPLTITTITKPTSGTAAIGQDQRIRYEPKSGFKGADSFTYTIADGYGGSTTASVSVVVEAASTTNRPPVANNDRISTQPGTRVKIDVLANDSDPDGDALKIVQVSSLPGVELDIGSGREITALPSANVAGLLSFTYSVADSGGLRATATVAFVVEAPLPAAPPVALDDAATTSGAPVRITVTQNDLNPGGGQVVISSYTQPRDRSGSVSEISANTLQFTPALGFLGTSRFTYSIQNEQGLTATASVSVQVTSGSGSGPVARDDQVTAFVGDPIIISPLDNDSHPDGLGFSFAGAPVVRSGSAVINANQTITYTPPNADPGVFVLSYTIQDKLLLRSSANIVVTVLARPIVNTAPIPVDDVQTTSFQTPVLIDVLGNDTDPDGDTMQIVAVGAVANATAVISGNRIRFTPANGSVGVISFTYTVQDPSGLSATAKVTVSVSDRVKVAPNASPDLVTLITGTSQTINPITNNDSDPDGSVSDLVLTNLGSPSPTGGATAVTNGNAVVITAGNKVGTYEFSYAIRDADGLTSTSTISVVVQAPPNTPPIATADAATILAVPSSINVLANDTDPDGGNITLTNVGAVSPGGAGTAVINGTSVLFTPNGGFSGQASFPYTIRDPQNATATSTVTVTVTACPAVPSLSAISQFTAVNTAVQITLFNGAAPAGNIAVSTPSAGTATLNGARTVVTYTPPQGFTGVANMSYSVTTACNNIATAVISVTVNRPPLAVNDVATTQANRSVVVPVLANDSDPDGDVIQLTTVGSILNGTAVADTDAGTVTFTPTPGYVGTTTFRYNIVDAAGATDNGKVTVTVANGAPVAVNDAQQVSTGAGPVSIAVLNNDSDPNGDTLHVVSVGAVSPGGAGTATVNVGATAVNFTVDGGFGPGTITFSYTVSDGFATATATVTITVQNQPPVAAPDSASLDTAIDASVTVDVVANDDDPEGGPLTLQSATVSNGGGSVTFSGHSITFTPTDVPSTVLVSYTITDSSGAAATGTLTITVT